MKVVMRMRQERRNSQSQKLMGQDSVQIQACVPVLPFPGCDPVFPVSLSCLLETLTPSFQKNDNHLSAGAENKSLLVIFLSGSIAGEIWQHFLWRLKLLVTVLFRVYTQFENI